MCGDKMLVEIYVNGRMMRKETWWTRWVPSRLMSQSCCLSTTPQINSYSLSN